MKKPLSEEKDNSMRDRSEYGLIAVGYWLRLPDGREGFCIHENEQRGLLLVRGNDWWYYSRQDPWTRMGDAEWQPDMYEKRFNIPSLHRFPQLEIPAPRYDCAWLYLRACVVEWESTRKLYLLRREMRECLQRIAVCSVNALASGEFKSQPRDIADELQPLTSRFFAAQQKHNDAYDARCRCTTLTGLYQWSPGRAPLLPDLEALHKEQVQETP